MADGGLCELFSDDREVRHVADADLFRILETWEECISGAGGGGGGGAAAAAGGVDDQGAAGAGAGGARTAANGRRREGRDEEKGGGGGPPAQKRQKGSSSATSSLAAPPAAAWENEGGAAKMSHITVERNRRKQMNEHLAVLRSLMPCFYVKRGDQASIIGGVVDYIKELQQVLRSLEAKKNRKAYADQVLSPRPPPPPAAAAAALMMKSTPPISPRLAVPISPRTPTPGSPYKHPAAGGGGVRPPHPAAATSSSSAAYSMSPAMTPTSSSSTTTTHELSPQLPAPLPPFLPILDSLVTELAARGRAPFLGAPAIADGGVLVPGVKVEFAGPNLVLKTVSHRAPGQALKIIAALESLSLEILHVSISTVDDTTVLSFTIKIGIECELSAEELVQEIQQTFL
ncbi:transcription factor SPEECHLESS-like [Oryza brachyantha]|uniref:transcription factor SPEECHLESS-like n=1 Tax=Oryza brachyantha TaxID=4533 RepID=UPI001ADD0864|nr:transcription factor SPEECHLESS-like [Oryza brachyantha]